MAAMKLSVLSRRCTLRAGLFFLVMVPSCQVGTGGGGTAVLTPHGHPTAAELVLLLARLPRCAVTLPLANTTPALMHTHKQMGPTHRLARRHNLVQRDPLGPDGHNALDLHSSGTNWAADWAGIPKRLQERRAPCKGTGLSSTSCTQDGGTVPHRSAP